MKKINLLLLNLICLVTLLNAQPNIVVKAPGYNSTSQGVAPGGTSQYAYMKACFLLKQNELSALTSSLITNFGFCVSNGATTPITGTITIYMQNTSDGLYLKGNNFTTAISPMSLVYSGAMTVPSGPSFTSNILMSLSTAFNYTGGGLYVAFDWACNNSLSPNSASYFSNYANTALGAFRSASTSGSGLNNLLSNTYRPQCIFHAVNTATNELGVVGLTALGKAATAINEPQIIMSKIKNNSTIAINNVNVNLSITGANPFTDSKTLASIAPGAVETVSFAPFSPAFLGNNYIVASIANDQNNLNNKLAWNQSVTCNLLSNTPPGNQTYFGVGYPNGTGILSGRFEFANTQTLTGIDFYALYTPNPYPISGVLLDSQSGSIIATTNTLTIDASMANTVKTLTFSVPEILSSGISYNIGFAVNQSNIFPLASLYADSVHTIGKFHSSPLVGGSFIPDDKFYFYLEPVLEGPHITITQASTVICYGEQIELTANGASSYTWSSSIFNPIDFPNDASILLAPTGNEVYTVTAVNDAGCIGYAEAPVAVKLCTDIKNEFNSNTELKFYPNPTHNGIVNLTRACKECKLEMYDVFGRMVLNEIISNGTIDLSEQPNGNYFIKIIEPNGEQSRFKLIKTD